MNGINGLFAAELRRFFSRRVMRGAFAFGIALSTLVLVIITVRSSVTTATASHNQFVCTQPAPGSPAPTDPSNGGQNCALHNIASKVTHDRRAKIHNNLSGTIGGTGVAMVFIALVIGSSFIGADFAALSLVAQLVFEPRRARVVVVKALAVAIGLAILAIAVLLYIALLQFAASSLRGVVSGLDGSWFAARAGDMGRVAGAVALAGVSAYAITVVAKRTVAAVAGLIVSGWVSAVIGQLHNWRFFAKYNPTSAFISMALDPSRTNGGHDALTARAATLSSCVWALGLTVIAAAIFARREVR